MKTLKQKGKDIVWVVAGNAVLALAVSMFILPYDILSGGVAGIAVALQPLIPLPVTLMVNILVVGLFVIGACFLGKEFAMKTILSSLIYPVFLTFFSSFALRRLIGRHGRRDGVKNRGEYRRNGHSAADRA